MKMGQGGQEGRLGEDHAATRLRGFAEEVGRRADLLWWLSQNRRMSLGTTSAFVFVQAQRRRLFTLQ